MFERFNNGLKELRNILTTPGPPTTEEREAAYQKAVTKVEKLEEQADYAGKAKELDIRTAKAKLKIKASRKWLQLNPAMIALGLVILIIFILVVVKWG